MHALIGREACLHESMETCCDVKMFCFSHANHASTNFKKFLSGKLDNFPLFTHFLVSWNSLQTSCVNFFAYTDILRDKNPYFGKHLFCKIRSDYACKTLCTRLCD